MATETWVEVGDKKSIQYLENWIKEGAKVTCMGICYVALAQGGFSYMGMTFRARHPEQGDHVVVICGHNCRTWGTTKGRAEMAHGDKADAGTRDPVPSVIAPWHQLCVWMPCTNGWKPRMSKELNALVEKTTTEYAEEPSKKKK